MPRINRDENGLFVATRAFIRERADRHFSYPPQTIGARRYPYVTYDPEERDWVERSTRAARAFSLAGGVTEQQAMLNLHERLAVVEGLLRLCVRRERGDGPEDNTEEGRTIDQVLGAINIWDELNNSMGDGDDFYDED